MKTDVSAILGIPVEDYDEAFKQLELKGGFDAIKVHKLLILLCKKMEQLELAQPLIVEKPKEIKLDKIPVYNPDIEDFKCVMRDEKTNKQMEPFIVPGKDIAYFEPKVAKHIKKQLASWLFSKRGIKTDVEAERAKIEAEINIKV